MTEVRRHMTKGAGGSDPPEVANDLQKGAQTT